LIVQIVSLENVLRAVRRVLVSSIAGSLKNRGDKGSKSLVVIDHKDRAAAHDGHAASAACGRTLS
jgi:hypothetical protein